MSDKRFSFKEFKSIYSKVPRLCVEVVLKKERGIVLTKREIEPYKGMWHIPGGTVYFGESLKKAVKRVAKDELGLETLVLKELGTIEYPSVKSEGYFGWPVGIAFLVNTKDGRLRKSWDASKVGFFKKLPQRMISEQRKFLEDNFRELF